MENKKTSLLAKITPVIGIVLLFMSILSCNGSASTIHDSKSLDTSAIDSGLIVTDVDTSSVPYVNTWSYTESEDKMTSKTNYFAKVAADELIYFNSPYDGGSTATLIVRYKPEGIRSIYVRISKGQFKTQTSGTYFKVRFDDHEAKTYEISNSSDGSSDIVFFDYYDLIDKIKSSRKMLIQAEFYQEGKRTIEFDISNLKWDH